MEEAKQLLVEEDPSPLLVPSPHPLPSSLSAAASRRPSSSLSPSAAVGGSAPPRRPPSSFSLGASSASPGPPSLPRSRAASVHVKALSPPYVAALAAYAASLSAPPASSAAFVSPLASSSLYSLSPHSVSLLFARYAESGADSQAVEPTSFQALWADFAAALLTEVKAKGLLELSGRVERWLQEDGGVEGWAARLFSALDARGSGRVEREDFRGFLPLVDAQLGERLRREWKTATVLPRLTQLASL